MAKLSVHKCKCHNTPYHVCPTCACEFCPNYWPTCPRCAEIARTRPIVIPPVTQQSINEPLRLTMIRSHVEAYRRAKAILAAHYTSVAERKAAIDVRDEFIAMAPAFVSELVNGIDVLIGYTDGEECADPESCNNARGNPVWLCSRCRLREIAR